MLANKLIGSAKTYNLKHNVLDIETRLDDISLNAFHEQDCMFLQSLSQITHSHLVVDRLMVP